MIITLLDLQGLRNTTAAREQAHSTNAILRVTGNKWLDRWGKRLFTLPQAPAFAYFH